MLNTPFAPWPDFSEEEAKAVRDVLLSNRVNYWTGRECRAFEEEFAAWCGVRHAVALTNGTVALELALKVLGVGAGDEVVVTPRSFMASASCVTVTGSVPVFADVDRDSQNISAESISSVITPRTRAIVCVHLAGWPCDMDPILELARKGRLFVIEDCAQAHGAQYKGRRVGSIGDVGAWSFCQDKIMTTGGEGGMLTTSNGECWKKAWAYKDHGKSWEAVHRERDVPGYRWLHESFGTNWRMLEIQAAIGRIQLRRMPDWHARRAANAKRIWQAASQVKGLRVPQLPLHCDHAAYRCFVFVDREQLAQDWDRDRIMQAINDAGVPCYSGGCPEIYREKAFNGTGWRPSIPLPVARELGETSLMFLVHPTLSNEEIDKTCATIEAVMRRAVHPGGRAATG